MKRIFLFLAIYLLVGGSVVLSQSFDIQGHRGCRGLMPENSIPGFIKAIDLGVTTVEIDVVISADGKVVVSHDPYISSKICVNELGREINKKEEGQINIYNMIYEDVMLFDCGINGNPSFPEQEKISVSKPLLSEVFEACEDHVKKSSKRAPRYNIELKSRPSWDGVYHPEPNLYTKLVFDVVKEVIPADRICIQSFDFRILHYWRMKYPEYTISMLVGNSKSVAKNIEELGFLKGVPFFWTLTHNFVPWVFAVLVLVAIFYLIDRRNKDGKADEEEVSEKVSIQGGKNFVWLLIVVLAVFLDPMSSIGFRPSIIMGKSSPS